MTVYALRFFISQHIIICLMKNVMVCFFMLKPLFFMYSRRKRYRQQQKHAAIIRAARR